MSKTNLHLFLVVQNCYIWWQKGRQVFCAFLLIACCMLLLVRQNVNIIWMVKVKSTFELIQLQHQIHSNSVIKCYASVFPYLLFPLVDKKRKPPFHLMAQFFLIIIMIKSAITMHIFNVMLSIRNTENLWLLW